MLLKSKFIYFWFSLELTFNWIVHWIILVVHFSLFTNTRKYLHDHEICRLLNETHRKSCCRWILWGYRIYRIDYWGNVVCKIIMTDRHRQSGVKSGWRFLNWPEIFSSARFKFGFDSRFFCQKSRSIYEKSKKYQHLTFSHQGLITKTPPVSIWQTFRFCNKLKYSLNLIENLIWFS